MDSTSVITTLKHAQAQARLSHNPVLEDDCKKAIEYVRKMAAELNGRAWATPRSEDEPEQAETS